MGNHPSPTLKRIQRWIPTQHRGLELVVGAPCALVPPAAPRRARPCGGASGPKLPRVRAEFADKPPGPAKPACACSLIY
jgi:hypothetical protein